MSTFPTTHPIAALRGRRIHDSNEVRATLAKRIAYLVWQLAQRQIDGRPEGAFMAELKGTVQALECWDAAHAGSVESAEAGA